MTPRIFLTSLLCLGLCAASLAGQRIPAAKFRLAQISVTPPPQAAPVQVDAGLFVEQIEAVRVGEGTFSIDGTLTLRWQDPRLAFSTAKVGAKFKLFLEKNAQQMLDKIWWPDVEFSNEIGHSEPEHEELTISSEGVVRYREKVHVTLGTTYETRRFPFDDQKLRVELASFTNDAEIMKFQVASQFVGLSPNLQLTGWQVSKIDEQVVDRRDLHDRSPFSEVQVSIGVNRDPGFFVTKFIIPICVLMIVLCGVLWVPANQIKDRVSATLTGMLAAAAYGFTITQYLPPNVYDTFLDAVVGLALAYCTGLMAIHVIASQLYLADKNRALRLDRKCRWIFPLAFTTGMIILGLIYLR